MRTLIFLIKLKKLLVEKSYTKKNTKEYPNNNENRIFSDNIRDVHVWGNYQMAQWGCIDSQGGYNNWTGDNPLSRVK